MIWVIEQAILRNYLKDEVDLTSESVFGNRVTDKWNNLPQCCINCTTLNSLILNIIFIRYWNRKLSKKSYNLDSERYMAKACAYLCRQCCFIDGFGEFGEIFASEREVPHLTLSLGNPLPISP